jgi:hypothetical protein
MHLVGFSIRIYQDARSSECQQHWDGWEVLHAYEIGRFIQNGSLYPFRKEGLGSHRWIWDNIEVNLKSTKCYIRVLIQVAQNMLQVQFL